MNEHFIHYKNFGSRLFRFARVSAFDGRKDGQTDKHISIERSCLFIRSHTVVKTKACEDLTNRYSDVQDQDQKRVAWVLNFNTLRASGIKSWEVYRSIGLNVSQSRILAVF